MKIGFLATGDELTTGEIQNSNGQVMAQTLFDLGYDIGSHILAPDTESMIVEAIRFLKQHHQAVIITGGLGPTSDDRTRFALARALDKKIFLHEPSWERLQERLKKFKLTVHGSNKQQAYFPETAEIIENPHGTANGCEITSDQTLFFMLPGPPGECLPMFHENVIPALKEKFFQNSFQNFRWRLFGVSEGEIAAQLDKLVEEFSCTTGYRWDYPYLEFKIRMPAAQPAQPVIERVEKTIQPHIICTPELTALDLFIRFLQEEFTDTLVIHDQATCGFLQYRLSLPTLHEKIRFDSNAPRITRPNFYLSLSGLDELRHNNPRQLTQLKLYAEKSGASLEKQRDIPFRSRRVLEYAVEYIAHEMLRFLQPDKS